MFSMRNFASAPLPEVDSDELVKHLDAKTPGLLVLDVRSPEASNRNSYGVIR